MGGCSAINCSNSSRKGHRLFKFPADPVRRKKWAINCRRNCWIPGPQAQLCSAHFEESQFEQNRADGWKKLKASAIPTLFDVPNPPAGFAPKRVKGSGCPKPGTILEPHISNVENVPECPLRQKIAELEAENKKLKEQLAEKDKSMNFLSGEQKKCAKLDRRSITNWSQEGILQGLKLRFALGKFGYNYLRTTGYPAPSYSTLNRRLQCINMEFGILYSIISLLKTKVDTMSESDKWCTLIIDEMDISSNKDFDKSEHRFVGNVTLGCKTSIGKHYTVVLLRGIKSPWKQIIAHEITGPSTKGEETKGLIDEIIRICKYIGLHVKSVVSDMGSNNKSMWKSFGVHVTRNERQISYTVDEGTTVNIMADVPHLLKNLRGATLSRPLILPENVCTAEELPSKYISSGYIKQLFINELDSPSCLRSLHHLNNEHLFPSHFGAMNVATAVQLFNIKTAAALEKAVHLRLIQKDALTTAWWIRLVNQWFQIMTARHRKKGITKRNKEEKFEFLHNFINIVQNIQLGKGWKPLQSGMILSTLSVIHIATEAFSNNFDFFLPGRLTQDALENVFSQIRRKSSLKPTAVQARSALKLICVSQFIADLDGTNYDFENDVHLLDISNIRNEKNEQHFQDTSLSLKPLSASDENDVYYIAGATLNSVSKQKLCGMCMQSLMHATDSTEPVLPNHLSLLTEYSDMGGLKRPTSGIYRICREAEREIQHHKEEWLLKELSIDQKTIDKIKLQCQTVEMPECCALKDRIINHYIIVRCKGIVNYLKNKAAKTTSYGSASFKKSC